MTILFKSIVFSFVLFLCFHFITDDWSMTFVNAVTAIRDIDFINAAILTVASWFFRVLKWRALLRVFEVKLSTAKASLIYFSGFFLFFLPAKTGELLKVYFLRKSVKSITYREGVIYIILDRLVDAFVVIGISLIYLNSNTSYPFANLSILIILIFLGVIVLNYLKRIERVDILSLFVRKIEIPVSLVKMTNEFLKFRIIMIFICSILAWLCQGAVLYKIFYAHSSELSLLNSIGIYCTSLILGIMSLLPSGIVSTELSIVSLLHGYGIDSLNATVGAFLSRSIPQMASAILGLVSCILLLLLGSRKVND